MFGAIMWITIGALGHKYKDKIASFIGGCIKDIENKM